MPIIPNISLEFGKAKQHKAYLHTSWIFCHLRNTAPKWEAGWSVGIVTSQSRKSLGETITYQDHLCRHRNLWIPTYTSESNRCQKCIIGKSHLPWHSSSLTDPKQWKSSLLFDSHKISNVTIWQHQCASLSPSYFPLMCSQYGRSCHLHLPEEENQKLKHAGWGYSSVLESLPSMPWPWVWSPVLEQETKQQQKDRNTKPCTVNASAKRGAGTLLSRSAQKRLTAEMPLKRDLKKPRASVCFLLLWKKNTDQKLF